MQRISDIAKEIVAREGGFVDDPDDPGGATKHGVTIHTLRRLGLDLDGDGDSDLADLHALTRQDAEAIFVEHYFHRPRIDALPEALQASVFDMYVNAGRNAVTILQTLLREMGQAVAVDGVIGPQTIAAAHAATRAAPRPYRRCLRNRAAELLFPPCRPPPRQPQIRTRPTGRQGRLDPARRGIHRPRIPPDRRRIQGKGRAMGVIDRGLDLVFGDGRNLLAETAEVFRENAEAGAMREADGRRAVLDQFGQEFTPGADARAL